MQLAKTPLFFREIPPQPRKHSNWEKADDFTNGQAHICRRHEATFPPGALDKHYEKLLINDGRLAELSCRPFPTHDNHVTEIKLFKAHKSVLPLQQIPQPQLFSSVLPLQKIPQHQLSSPVLPLQKIPQHQISSSVLPLQKIPQHPFSSSVLPLQQIPQQQFHHSLNSNSIAASASSNGVMAAWGNQINNKPTFVDSSRQNHPLVLDQRLHQYNEPTFVGQSSQNPVVVPASTFVDSSRQNHPLVVPDQRLYPTFVCQLSQNPVVVPASTFVDSSSSQNSSVVTDQHLYPPSSCLPRFMQHGPSEAQYFVQNGPDAGEEALAEAIVMGANATCDDEAWSLLDLFIMQSQEDHCNEPVDDGNEASSISPAPPTGP